MCSIFVSIFSRLAKQFPLMKGTKEKQLKMQESFSDLPALISAVANVLKEGASEDK